MGPKLVSTLLQLISNEPEAAPVAEMVRASDAPNSALDAVAE